MRRALYRGMVKMASRWVHIPESAGSSPAAATMKKDKDIEQYIADAVMERPYGFSVNDMHFYLYPVTLGKMYLLQRQVDSLEINDKILNADVSMEALRLVRNKREQCLTIICYHTCRTPEELFDPFFINERKNLFDKEMSEEDIAALMLIVLTSDKTKMFITHLGIDKEKDRLAMVMKVKNKGNKNNLTFGGKSIFGSMIDAACERYGWTKRYVVWEIDYTSLKLMLDDKVSSVYCTDDEMKKLPASVRHANDDVIKPTKENMKQILEMDWR